MNSKTRLTITICVVLGCLVSRVGLATTGWPKLTGDTTSVECSDAYLLAKGMFNSPSQTVYAPLRIPDGMQSQMILGTSTLDISGGDALEADEEEVEKVPHEGAGSFRSPYWTKHVDNGARVVVTELPIGWKGDTYQLYVIDENVTQAGFLEDLGASHQKYKALISGAWRPPLVFKLKSSNRIWFIDVGEPAKPLDEWKVNTSTLNGLEQHCVIKFRPDMKNVESLLSQPVQKLALLLDQTHGPGLDEGTLQPTARLRIHVQHVWVNAVLRPWALSESDTYNSREEVLSGLEDWSHSGPSYKRHFRQILQTYPVAEKSLYEYYVWQFRLPKRKARALAKWVLDIAFRSGYAFSNGGDYFRFDNVNNNPWKKE